MTISTIVTLFGTMAVLASIPSVSVMAVSARSAAYGFVHGVFTTLGVVLGDIIFILLAISGLSILTSAMGGYFVLVKYLGGGYLIWLGIALWRSKTSTRITTGEQSSSVISSFLTGLFITLGDQKAILFYLGLFPAFVDLSTISPVDTGIIILIAVMAVGGAKLMYAFMADKVASLTIPKLNQVLNKIAGSVVTVVGISLIVHA